MSLYNITLTSAEDMALSSIALSQDEWIQNAVHARCQVAIDEIVQIAVAMCLAQNIQVPGSKDEIVQLAFQNGWVVTAAERQAAYEASVASRGSVEE